MVLATNAQESPPATRRRSPCRPDRVCIAPHSHNGCDAVRPNIGGSVRHLFLLPLNLRSSHRPVSPMPPGPTCRPVSSEFGAVRHRIPWLSEKRQETISHGSEIRWCPRKLVPFQIDTPLLGAIGLVIELRRQSDWQILENCGTASFRKLRRWHACTRCSPSKLKCAVQAT